MDRTKDVGLADRLLARMTIDAKTGCWNRTTVPFSTGYARIQVEGSGCLAHRIAHEVFIGPIPDGLHVLHTCDNPRCINPRHLTAGTHAQNMADRNAKDRQAHNRGAASGNAKLTEADVAAIRASKGLSLTQLTQRYPVGRTQLSRIRSGQRW